MFIVFGFAKHNRCTLAKKNIINALQIYFFIISLAKEEYDFQ